MKTVSSRSQYLDDQLACIIDSLIFGHLQRKQYTKTLHALLSESPHLTKDATTVPSAPNQIILNVNSFLHDQNLEQIIESFYTYGRFDVSPNMLELGKKLRDLTNEFASELAFGCHSYSKNDQRLYGRKVRTRPQQTSTMLVDRRSFFSKNADHGNGQVSLSVNESSHNNHNNLQYSQAMESHDMSAEHTSNHENAHHSRRKVTQPQKQSHRMMQYVETQLVKMSNENMRDKDAGVDNTSFLIDPFLDADNFQDILKNVVDDDTLYETLETYEREEAMEADQNSRDSMNLSCGNASLALDIPMHDDIPSTSHNLVSHHDHRPSTIHPQSLNTFYSPPTIPSHHVPISIPYPISRPITDQYTQQPSTGNHMENHVQNTYHTPLIPPRSRPLAPSPLPPPPPRPPPSSLPPPSSHPNHPAVETHSKIVAIELEKKQTRAGDIRETFGMKNARSPSQHKSRLPPSLPPPPPPPSSSLPSTSTAITIPPRMSSLGRIPKKVQPSVPPIDSPSASPRTNNIVSIHESNKSSEVFRMSKGKIAPQGSLNDDRRDSMDSQDTQRAESVGESDCTMTENEDNDHPIRKEVTKEGKAGRKATWDDLFDDSPPTVEEANRQKEKQKELQENKRRMEMRELEKKKEREKRKKDKHEDDRRDRSRDDKNRYDRRPGEDRRRDSMGREDREERERDREDKQRKNEIAKRKDEEERKKILEAHNRQKETEDRARQKRKEEEERKREMKEKEEQKRKEKDKEMKKIEDEKMKIQKEIKLKEEKRNELERRRRKEVQLRKINEKPSYSINESPLDKIAAEMDGKELKKEKENETIIRARSRVMEISSGLERNHPYSLNGSLHSSKSGIQLDKAQKLRETTERPAESRRPIRPNRVQMAPMKRPPTAMTSEGNESDDDDDEDDDETHPVHKKGKIEDHKMSNILNKIYP